MLERDPGAGVGEIGMDRTRITPDVQMEVFVRQLRIARDMHRPVTIHMKGFEKEVLDALRSEHGRMPTILHSFSQESYVEPFRRENCYFSVGPRLLAKNDAHIERIVGGIPEDRLLVETDAPYAGKEFRGVRDLIERI